VYLGEDNCQAFREACAAGHLEVAKWFLRRMGRYHVVAEREAACAAASNGHLAIVQWLVDPPLEGLQAQRLFGHACRGAHLATARWVWDMISPDTRASIENHCLTTEFLALCSKGDLEFVKWLVTLGKVDVHANNEQAFCAACMSGYEELAMWLHKSYGVNIHVQDDKPFQQACRMGADRLAAWLFGLESPSRINIHARQDALVMDLVQDPATAHVARWLVREADPTYARWPAAMWPHLTVHEENARWSYNRKTWIALTLQVGRHRPRVATI
jgi:hypothetical protein